MWVWRALLSFSRYNVVIKNQHSTDGQRELLYPGTSDCSLVLEHVLLLDVEYNHLAYSKECEEVAFTVAAENDPARFNPGAFAIPNVEVNVRTYVFTWQT
jgi:hypothetical protein